MKLRILLLLLLIPAFSFSEECVFDQKAQAIERIEFMADFEVDEFIEESSTFIINDKYGKLELFFGGCQHYGVDIKLYPKDQVDFQKLSEVIIHLVDEYDQLGFTGEEASGYLRNIQWSLTQNTYFLHAMEVSQFMLGFREKYIFISYNIH